MKDEIMNRLNAVLNALNNIDVRGKANLANLSGSIAVIEETCAILADAEVTSPKSAKGK